MNVQCVCRANLTISNVVARLPGSVHDSAIFNNSRLHTEFETEVYRNYIMLGKIVTTISYKLSLKSICTKFFFFIGDSGYPLLNYLMTQLLHTARYC